MNSYSNSSQAYWAVVPAAGVGTRFGAACPKQYLDLLGSPMIRHTLDKLLHYPLIQKVVIAINMDDEYWPDVYHAMPDNLLVTRGGRHRADSVLQGLHALQDKAAVDDWVLVHDVVRPCISTAAIDRLIDTCSEDPVGGLLGLPVSDTLKHLDSDQQVLATLPREQVWQAQTPQMFRYGLLLDALQQAKAANLSGITDEASAIEQQGLQPKMVLGEAFNIKVTHAEDLALAQWYLQQE